MTSGTTEGLDSTRVAVGYFLRRDGMKWFWDQYTTDAGERALPTASPLRAPTNCAGCRPL